MTNRIFVVASDVIYRRGVAWSIDLMPEIESVVQVADAVEAMANPALPFADLVLVDGEMVGALDLAHAAIDHKAQVIVYATDPSQLHALAAIGLGCGYLSKARIAKDAVLQAAVRSALAGLPPVDRPPRPRVVVSDREKRILKLLSEGHPTREVADTLHYSERTVKNIIRGLNIKFNATGRVHLVALALREGII